MLDVLSSRRIVSFHTLTRVVLVVLTLSAAACGDLPASPTFGTISAEGLAGEWRLELLQPAAHGAVLTPTGATYVLRLQDGAASARADCNTCTGRYTVVGDTLYLSTALACTRAACPTASFEALYTRILAGESTVVVDGPRMTLVSSRGFLRFIR